MPRRGSAGKKKGGGAAEALGGWGGGIGGVPFSVAHDRRISGQAADIYEDTVLSLAHTSRTLEICFLSSQLLTQDRKSVV